MVKTAVIPEREFLRMCFERLKQQAEKLRELRDREKFLKAAINFRSKQIVLYREFFANEGMKP